VRRDLSIQRLQQRVPERLIEHRGVPAHHRDESPGCERGARARQHDAISANEVQLLRQVAPVDRRSNRGLGRDLLQRDQTEPLRRYQLPEPRRGRDAQAAIGVVEQRPGPVHERSIRFTGTTASITLLP
jgi:hypothetical protein